MLEKKKGTSGNASNFITRTKAMRKLQIGLPQFRRLCILKGIYPREPKKKFEGATKTYYLRKDIQFLLHEPLLAKSREMRAYHKKIKKARAKQDRGQLKMLLRNKPTYQLDHIVRERYPSFPDALRDLDDALTLVHLFARLPSEEFVKSNRTKNCERLVREFQNYIAITGSLGKVFVSIKGIYYSSTIQGEHIVWSEPHRFTQQLPKDVDFKVMITFLEFYECLLNFVNYRLYTTSGYDYPPRLDRKSNASGSHLSALKVIKKDDLTRAPNQVDSERVNHVQARIAKMVKEKEDNEEANEDDESDRPDDEGMDDVEAQGNLTAKDGFNEGAKSRRGVFSNLKFFLGRETPINALEFVIRARGGVVGWEGDASPFGNEDPGITHWIVDRPALQGTRRMNIEYVQPQWVFDSVNNEQLLPVSLYGVGTKLPPHLSPFVDDEAEGYTPKYRTYIERLRAGDPGLFKESALGAFNILENEGRDRVESDSDDDEDEEKNENVEVNDVEGEEDSGEEDENEVDEEKEGESISGDEDNDEAEISVEKGSSAKELKELARGMMSKKKRNLYDRMMYTKKKRSSEVERLVTRREELDEEENEIRKKSRKASKV